MTQRRVNKNLINIEILTWNDADRYSLYNIYEAWG